MSLYVVLAVAMFVGGCAAGAFWQQWRWRHRTGGEARWLRRALWDGTISDSGEVGDILPRMATTTGPLKEFVRLHTVDSDEEQLRARLETVRAQLAEVGPDARDAADIVVHMMTIRAEQTGYWEREVGHVLGQVCLEGYHLLRRVANLASVSDQLLWLVFQSVMITWAIRSLSDREFAKGLRTVPLSPDSYEHGDQARY